MSQHRNSIAYRGTAFKTRPTLQGLQGTGTARTGIALRWIGWLAVGWAPTALALTTAAVIVVTAVLPLIIGLAAATVAVIASPRSNLLLAPLAALTGPLVVVTAWRALTPITQILVLVLIGVWPVDALVGMRSQWYRTRRLWAEFRRGFPIRFAILAAKSTRIQGPLDGEQQLTGGRRPILDHPALDQRATFNGSTVTCRVSVSPGRKHEALREVLPELAASFVHVNRIDLTAVDDYQTFGHLTVHFNQPPEPATGEVSKVERAKAIVYQLPARTGVTAVIAAITWTAIT